MLPAFPFFSTIPEPYKLILWKNLMETRTIGSLNVTLVGIGCNNFGKRIEDKACPSRSYTPPLMLALISLIRLMYTVAHAAKNS